MESEAIPAIVEQPIPVTRTRSKLAPTTNVSDADPQQNRQQFTSTPTPSVEQSDVTSMTTLKEDKMTEQVRTRIDNKGSKLLPTLKQYGAKLFPKKQSMVVKQLDVSQISPKQVDTVMKPTTDLDTDETNTEQDLAEAPKIVHSNRVRIHKPRTKKMPPLDELIKESTKSMIEEYPIDPNPEKIKLIISGVRLVSALILFIFLMIWFAITVKANKKSDLSTVEKPKTNYPVIVWYTDHFPKQTLYCYENKIEMNCDIYSRYYHTYFNITNVDAYLFFGDTIDFTDLPLPRRPEILWGLIHKTSPINTTELLADEMITLFNLTSTFSRHSNVPFPLIAMPAADDITSELFFQNTSIKNDHLIDHAPVLYYESDCNTLTERDEYVIQLMKHIQVDSFGECVNNKKLPELMTPEAIKFGAKEEMEHRRSMARFMFFAKYKFVIAIEDTVCDDYITNGFWTAIHTGVVPIYFGSPSIRDFMPNNKSAILVQDYATPKLLSDLLYKLINDDRQYEEYLEHKTKKQISNRNLLSEIMERPYQYNFLNSMDTFICLACKKLHKKGAPEFAGKKHYNCSLATALKNLEKRSPFLKKKLDEIEKGVILYRNITRIQIGY